LRNKPEENLNLQGEGLELNICPKRERERNGEAHEVAKQDGI